GRPRGPSPARGVAFRAARAPRHETPRARGRRTVTPWPGAQEAAACGRRCARGTRLQDSPEANRRVGSASGPGTGGRSAESVTPPGERGAGHRMAGALPLQDGRTHSSSEARGESQTPRSPVRGTTERCTRRTDARTRPARPTVSQTRPAATVRANRQLALSHSGAECWIYRVAVDARKSNGYKGWRGAGGPSHHEDVASSWSAGRACAPAGGEPAARHPTE
ncbi:unnamed protein product, partial [Prorocentrum cordatum]